MQLREREGGREGCTVHSEEGLRPKRCVTKIILVKKCSPTHFAPSTLPIWLRLPMHSAPLYIRDSPHSCVVYNNMEILLK